MTSKNRTDLLTTTELYHLDHACQVISRAFGGQCPYLVGTAGVGGAGSYRDVDVRLMLGDDEFAASCPTRERWELLCLSVSAYLSSRTGGLPIDFQIQRKAEALERFGDKAAEPARPRQGRPGVRRGRGRDTRLGVTVTRTGTAGIACARTGPEVLDYEGDPYNRYTLADVKAWVAELERLGAPGDMVLPQEADGLVVTLGVRS